MHHKPPKGKHIVTIGTKTKLDSSPPLQRPTASTSAKEFARCKSMTEDKGKNKPPGETRGRRVMKGNKSLRAEARTARARRALRACRGRIQAITVAVLGTTIPPENLKAFRLQRVPIVPRQNSKLGVSENATLANGSSRSNSARRQSSSLLARRLPGYKNPTCCAASAWRTSEHCTQIGCHANLCSFHQ